MKRKTVKAWALYLEAYYPVFVAAVEGLEGGKGGPPKNHLFAKMFEDMGQRVLWEKYTITYSLPVKPKSTCRACKVTQQQKILDILTAAKDGTLKVDECYIKHHKD